MKKCTKCDITYADDKKFCKKCGSSLSQEYNIDPKELAKKTVYEEKLKADSLNTDLLLEYSQFLYNNLLFKEAVSNLLKILAINENQKQANELLFKCYLKLSIYSDARDVGKQLLENNKTDMFVLEELANIETQLDNKAKAIEYYETILKIQPANTKALYSKANIFVKSKELEKAINIFKELYKEGDRDRITIIYAGIDKCLSDNYDGAIEILTPCLSEEDVSISDLNNQRGFIYLIYSLCKTKTPINKIDEWFSWLDFELLKNFMQPKDEEILAKTIFEIINIHFARDKQDIASENINYVIDKYINKSSFCFTAHTNNVFAVIWANISELQKGLGLFSDAQASLKKASELSPGTTEYINKLGDVTALFEKNKKQQKRKAFTIVASLITLIIVILISVSLFNRHKENKAWEKAKNENTYESYGNYLSNYPDNRYSEEAANFQEEVLWGKANEMNTVESYDEYLQKYPNGRFYLKASEQKEDVIWQETIDLNSFDHFFSYYQKYPDGKYIKIFSIRFDSYDVNGHIKFIGTINETTNKGYGIGIVETNQPDWNGVYQGEWLNNKRYGKGFMTWNNNTKYDGGWVDNLMQGNGLMKWEDGSYYDGNWEKGVRSGYGKLYYNGRFFDGGYGGGYSNSAWLLCEGNFRNNLFHGQFKITRTATHRLYEDVIYSGTLNMGKGRLNAGGGRYIEF